MGRPERVLLPRDTDLRAYLLSLSHELRHRAVELLGPAERDSLDRDWPTWAHDGQEPPPACADGSDWRTWVIMAGRSFGKTLTGSHWITAAVATGEKLAIALVGATLDDARRVMVEGRSGLLEVADAWVTEWQPSLRRIRFRTGAEVTLFSGASPDQLRGPEHHIAWCDELAKWEKPSETWDMLQLGLRLGPWPRAIVTTTPRPGPHLKRIMAAPGCVVTGGPSSANPHNSPAWLGTVASLYAGTRFGRQELEGELLPDAPGALWTVDLIEKCRWGAAAGNTVRVERSRDALPSPVEGRSEAETGTEAHPRLRSGPPLDPSAELRRASARGERTQLETASFPPDQNGGGVTSPGSHFGSAAITLIRLVVAVDPPSGDGTCGIIACARDSAGRAHVLADHSVTARSPEGWSRAVADAARIWSQRSSPSSLGEGDHPKGGGGAGEAGMWEGEGTLPVTVVAESNQGGQMVKAVLRTADPNLRVKLVHATCGKSERAAPVAMLFEAGKVTLHGRFPELEAELLGMIAGGDYEGPGVSPDRADAMVWGLTELMLAPERAPPRVRAL